MLNWGAVSPVLQVLTEVLLQLEPSVLELYTRDMFTPSEYM
jgi:hypothetical protein